MYYQSIIKLSLCFDNIDMYNKWYEDIMWLSPIVNEVSEVSPLVKPYRAWTLSRSVMLVQLLAASRVARKAVRTANSKWVGVKL